MLQIKDLTVAFGKQTILQSIGFSASGTLGIIGPNGSGKTTLFNALSGFVSAQKGSILIDGIDISSLAPDRRAQAGVARVFQNFGVFRDLTVLENVTLALSVKLPFWKIMLPVPGIAKQLSQEAVQFLEQVGIADRRFDKANLLSGGQMRLLEIARALAMDKKVYLLDEPTAGVSPKLKEQVAAAIRLLIAAKKTVLIIEHDMNFIRSFVDRILVLDQGSIVSDGSPEAVVADPVVQEIYFGR